VRRFRKVHLMVVPVTLAAALPAMTVELASDKRRFLKPLVLLLPLVLMVVVFSGGLVQASAPVVLVTDIIPGFGSSLPEELTKVGKDLFFNARDVTNGRELWKTD